MDCRTETKMVVIVQYYYQLKNISPKGLSCQDAPTIHVKHTLTTPLLLFLSFYQITTLPDQGFKISNSTTEISSFKSQSPPHKHLQTGFPNCPNSYFNFPPFLECRKILFVNPLSQKEVLNKCNILLHVGSVIHKSPTSIMLLKVVKGKRQP